MKASRVLIIEDDVMIAMLFENLLAGMGHAVCAIAATEADAVAAAIRHKPDLMIVDGRLNHGSGEAAVDEIQRTGKVPHIFVSGDPPASIQARRPGAVVIGKPFREAELANAIQRALTGTAAD
ncbi:MAG TPA: response regulator [Stellaceae bacterium]|nr:response regulator [Stellaceae bacterium]